MNCILIVGVKGRKTAPLVSVNTVMLKIQEKEGVGRAVCFVMNWFVLFIDCSVCSRKKQFTLYVIRLIEGPEIVLGWKNCNVL